MKYHRLMARLDPTNWHVLTNNGTTITAINTAVQETFSGTSAQLKAILSTPKPVYNGNPEQEYDQDTGEMLTASQDVSIVVLGKTGKAVVANGAATTLTVPANRSAVHVTTSASSLNTTLPVVRNIPEKDGFVLSLSFSAAVATATWTVPNSGTIAGAPAAIVANTAYRFWYDNATNKWYPF